MNIPKKELIVIMIACAIAGIQLGALFVLFLDK